MISVIVYGRNDSHGYNMHKRVAISLNCISELLTDPDDEILFVDCNTPDDLPTLCESIQDTLTEKAKTLLKILRIRPEQYERYKRGSPLKVLEPLCRNVAIRRSNPKNRWILSTNPDIVLVPIRSGNSLSEIVKGLPDGFYELPRFEVPESIWEMFDRKDPISIIEFLTKWGTKFRLNLAIISDYVSLYTIPGDFQLMLREQIFKIHGFNESMIYGWHLDSNLCKRMYLLNGKTRSLINLFMSYHLDHTKQATATHLGDRKEDSLITHYFLVESPYLPQQSESWGIPNEDIEEIRLDESRVKRHFYLLKDHIPPYDRTVVDYFIFNHGLIVDKFQLLPYLSDYLISIPSNWNIGYIGRNSEILKEIALISKKAFFSGKFLFLKDLTESGSTYNMPKNCIISDLNDLLNMSSLFIVDCSMNHLPLRKDKDGITFPKPSMELIRYAKRLSNIFFKTVLHEAQRIKNGNFLPRKFIIIGSQYTFLEDSINSAIEIVHTPYSTRLRHGFLKRDFDPNKIILPKYHLLIFHPTHILKVLSIKFKKNFKYNDLDISIKKGKKLFEMLNKRGWKNTSIENMADSVKDLDLSEVDLSYLNIVSFYNIINKDGNEVEIYKYIRKLIRFLKKLHKDR